MSPNASCPEPRTEWGWQVCLFSEVFAHSVCDPVLIDFRGQFSIKFIGCKRESLNRKLLEICNAGSAK